MIDDPFTPTYDIRRYEMVAQLEKLGPRFTTSVLVNGRALLLDAAIRLVEQLPEEARMGRRGVQIFVEPDPFAHAKTAAAGIADGARSEEEARMLTRLIERQDETDRRADEERRDSSWWRKLSRLMTRPS